MLGVRLCCWRRDSPMPIASKAFQAFFHVVNANPVILSLSDDSNTKLRIPSLQNSLEILEVSTVLHNTEIY